MRISPAKLEEFARICREKKLPLTIQRRAVLEELVAVAGHPTAEEVYERVRIKVPGISRATVYRVLETLVEAGLSRRVFHPGAAARFEVKTQRHHHLVCAGCGKIIDLEDPALDNLPFPDARKLGFSIDDYTVQFYGRCPACSPQPGGRRGQRARVERRNERERKRESNRQLERSLKG